MNKIIKLVVVLIIFSILICGGFWSLRNVMATDLNGNDIKVSKALSEDGEPKEVIKCEDGELVSKNNSNVYVSIKVNKKGIDTLPVTLKFNNEIIDEVEVEVSKAGYLTYEFKDLDKYEEGLYQVCFYDTSNEVARYFGITLE